MINNSHAVKSQEPYISPIQREFTEAIDADDVEKARALIVQGANFRGRSECWDNSYGKYGSNFHHAIFMGSEKVLNLFFELGATIDMKGIEFLWDADGAGRIKTPPLYYAVFAERTKIAQFLLDKGASAMDPVRSQNSNSIIYYMLHKAAEMGSIEMVQLLLENEADINAKCFQGMTALHYAMKGGHTSVVRFLIGWDADTSILDDKNRGFNARRFTYKIRLFSYFGSSEAFTDRKCIIDDQPLQCLAEAQSEVIQETISKVIKNETIYDKKTTIIGLIMKFTYGKGIFSKAQSATLPEQEYDEDGSSSVPTTGR